jgi:hypothetical protein
MRVDITSWSDVINNATHTGLKLDLHVESGILDATVHGYFVPDGGAYDLYPDRTQHHATVKEIFFDWVQVHSQSHWQSETSYWFIFTHPEKNLPCVVEINVHAWI